MVAYRDVVNSVIDDVWDSMEWREKEVKGKEQKRLIPYINNTREFKAELRDKYLSGWKYASHWVDSAIKTAYSILESWRKNYVKGDRGREKPRARRLFLRVKQTLCKLEGDRLRISLDGNGQFVYVDLSKRYFKLPDDISSAGIGEPVVTLDRIYLPIHYNGEQKEKPAEKVAWDSNMLSMDGYSPETGWVKIDTKALASVHISSFEKRRSVQRKASKSKKAKRVMAKYSKRERNRVKKHTVEIARVITSLSDTHGFESLSKQRMFSGSRVWNRGIARTDWGGIKNRVKEAGNDVVELAPQYTSKTCSRCGWVNKDLRGAVFECRECGLRIDRQLNASINHYLKMEGVPHDREWWDTHILPTLVGGYFLKGAERKGPDEPVRGLCEAVKPKLYYAYDRHADAYLPVPM